MRPMTIDERAPSRARTVARPSDSAPHGTHHTAHRAAVIQQTGKDKFALLEAALAQAEFWPHLEQMCQQAQRAPESLRIFIKPDLNFFDEGAPTGTDPQLVAHLIDLLHERGYTEVIVGEGSNSFALWLENRDIPVLADIAGYHFVTPQGHAYDIVDLADDLIDVDFPPGTVLHRTALARAWVEADYRICFAKNKTDEENFYALGVQNLLGVLPLRDKLYHYHQRLHPGDVCLELIRQTPIHFSLIDAVVSNHGGAGWRVAAPLITETIIAGNDLLLVDWVGALKMGLDPFVSTINAVVLRAIGLPPGYQISGNLTPYANWVNVPPLMVDSIRRRNQAYETSRVLIPWLQVVNQVLFPFKELLDEQVNSYVAKYFADVDNNPLAFWLLTGLNYALGALQQSMEAYQTLYDKDRLRWQEAPLNLDLATHSLDDYTAIVDYLTPLAALVQQLPADTNGLRWRYLEQSVLFSFERLLPIPFDEFTAHVDISRAIQLMNDYIGGVAVPVAHDDEGRVTHQAERNLYLPQPNYLALYDGKVIDVTKLEWMRYGSDDQQIFWKTIKSENGSAQYDDGIVTFARGSEDDTLVTIFGRQLFNLPPFWQMVNLDLYPPLKDFLVAHAYTTFFSQTIANFEATCEGRQVRIGRPWNTRAGEADDAGQEPPPTVHLIKLIELITNVVQQYWGGDVADLLLGPAKSAQLQGQLDSDGFRHFAGSPPTAFDQRGAPSSPAVASMEAALKRMSDETTLFWGDLVEAMAKDATHFWVPAGSPDKQGEGSA